MNLSRRAAALSVLFLFTAISPAFAVDGQGRAMPKGIGVMPCSQFIDDIKAKKDEELGHIIEWLAGFFTAVNIMNKDTYDLLPWQNEGVLLDLMARLCEPDPKKPIAAIADSLTASFAPSRLATKEELTEVKNGSASTKIYPSVMKQVQQTLIQLGQLSGTADGNFGSKTKNALEAFQDKYKLQKTGIPDIPTIYMLLLVNASKNPQPGQTPGKS